MSDAEWDAEDFVPKDLDKRPAVDDKWEGEDEEEDLKDNWDDEDEENKPAPTEDGEANKATQVKKKKPLKDRIAEKEAKMKAEAAKKTDSNYLDAYTSNSTNAEEAKKEDEVLTPEGVAAAKEKARRAQEESDLQLAKEAFGVDQERTEIDSIDASNPRTKEEFDKFEEVLKVKITQFEKSAHYVGFLVNLFRDLSLSLETDDLKKLGSTITAVNNEKLKLKAGKGKKKKKGFSLTVGRDDEFQDYTTASYDACDDFI